MSEAMLHVAIGAITAIIVSELAKMRGYKLGVRHMMEESIREAWRSPDGRVGERNLRRIAGKLENE